VKILGTTVETIDLAEDRERFRKMMRKLSIPHPESGMAINLEEALAIAGKVGYPLMVRPSYVLGGRGMEVVHDEEMLGHYVAAAVDDIPLTVGGGIASLEDIELVLRAGADKISMNSAAVKNPDLVREAAEEFGSEVITIAIDGRRNKEMPSGFELVISGGTKPVGTDAVAWARQCENLGAGVILPTSMNGDGSCNK
jgi:hypothetical protein